MDHQSQVLWTEFMLGGVVVCCVANGLFFLKFYRRTKDRLLAIFAIAFWVLGLNWIGLAAIEETNEVRPWLYAIRFLAFLAIAIGILDKNRSPRKS